MLINLTYLISNYKKKKKKGCEEHVSSKRNKKPEFVN